MSNLYHHLGGKRTRRLRAAAALAIPLLLAECGLLDSCIFESRYVGAAGRVTEGITEIAAATVDVSATRGGGALNDKAFQWSITTPALAGHVTRISLIRSSQPVPILLDLPVQNLAQPFVYNGGLRQAPQAMTPNLGGIFEIVAANEARIDIITDLPERPAVQIPLAVTMHQDWHRPNCS